MVDNTTYKTLIEVTKTYNESISKINENIINSGATDAIQVLSDTLKNSPVAQIKQNFSSIANAMEKYFGQYSKITNIDALNLSESLKKTVNVLQAATAERLQISYSTEMIDNLKVSFVKAQYEEFPPIINSTINKPLIGAADIAFLKTPGFLSAFEDKLSLPRGMKTSLYTLQTQTSEIISKNGRIEYDTKTNEFVSGESRIKSGEMNVICSGQKLFSAENGELFSEIELMDFQSFLSKTPTMAMKNMIGERIYSFLNDLFQSKKNYIEFDCDLYYHSRNKKKDDAPYTADEMMKVPHGLSGPGRYNHSGRSHYYFSDKQSGSENEMKKYRKADEVTQTIKLKPKKEAILLDLSGSDSGIETFLKYIRFPISEANSKTPREYLIPCFVSDCCQIIGFEGIKYYGSKEYNNYVTWSDGYFKDAGMCEMR